MVKVTLSKTTKVLIILAVALILGGSGGYLLWRVNQEKTVAPTDSDAGGGSGAPACPSTCTCSTGPTANCGDEPTPCYLIKCPDGVWINTTDPSGGCEGCGHSGTKPSTSECNLGSQCAACDWPKVAYCNNHNCDCILPDNIPSNQIQCGEITACSPADCPTGWTNCGTSADNLSKTGCTAKTTCTTACTICANKSTVKRYCKQGTNTCDTGSWKSKPTGTYEYCEKISYSAEGTDSDGVDEASITVKLNNSAKATFDKTSTATTTTITDDLSTTTECLDPGEYTLDVTWKDKKGASSTNCMLTTTFEVLEQGTPAEDDWEITKKASEQCLNKDTENPTSVISYVITVTNNAAQEESLDKIIDVLDTKVLESYLGSISGGGTFASGSITWELEGTAEIFTAGQSKTYTYTITVPETVFGSYTNTVTGYPKEGDNFSDAETIIADCVVTPDEQPQTGIFDSTISKVLLGILMIMIGFNLHKISQVQLFLKKFGTSIDEVSDERRKRNFERKIVKK